MADSSQTEFDFSPPRVQLRDHARKSTVLAILTQVAKAFINMGPIVVLSRLLPPSDFGLMAMAVSITNILGSIRESGLSAATIQAPKISHAQVSALFWINLFLGVGVAILCLAVGPIAAYTLKQAQLTPLIIAIGCIGIIGSASIQHDAIMQRKMEFKTIMTRDILSQLIGVGVGIGAAYLGAGIWSLVLMQAASTTISCVTLWTACAWRPSRPADLAVAKPMINFGLKVLFEKFVNQATRGLDAIVIGYFHGTTSVGHYSRAQGLLNKPMTQALNPIMTVVRPALSRAAEDFERLQRSTLELLRLISFVSAGVVAVLMPASPAIVLILLGDTWGDTVPIFKALTIFAMVEPCASLVGSVIVASGRPGALLKWRFVSVAIIVAGLLAAVPFGTVAMAYTFSLVGLFVRTPLFLLYASRVTGIPYLGLLKSIVPSTLVAVITVVTCEWANAHFPLLITPAFLPVLLAGAATLYLGLSFALPGSRLALMQTVEQALLIVKRKAKKNAPATLPPKA